MKQKYVILKDDENKALVIKEYAELDKEIFSLLCEQTYDTKAIKDAIKEGLETLIATLRTPNMYPIERYAVQMAEEVVNLYKSKETDSKELFFDDIDILIAEREEPELEDDDAQESVEIDDLLEDDSSDDSIDDEIKDITKPIKIADDDSVDVEDED